MYSDADQDQGAADHLAGSDRGWHLLSRLLYNGKYVYQPPCSSGIFLAPAELLAGHR